MNFVIDLAHHGVFVAQWLSIGARNPKVWGSTPQRDSEIFSLSHVRNETKNNFLYFFIELKTYHFSYHLSEFEGLKFESSWRRKTSILVMYWYSSPADATDTNIKYLFGIYHSDKGLLKKGKYDLKHPWPGDYVKIVLLNHTIKILT